MPQRDPNYTPPPREEREPKRGGENNRVPKGHRSKCQACGAVDKSKLKGNPGPRRCLYCGSTIQQRRATKRPNIKSFVLILQLDHTLYEMKDYQELFGAQQGAYFFVEQGPVARSRVAQIVELLDNERTGNVQVLSYENYKQRRRSLTWTNGCVACKGRGLVFTVVRPATGDRKAVTRSLPCVECHGLGGELTRRLVAGRAL